MQAIVELGLGVVGLKEGNSSATHMLFFTAVAGELTEDDHIGNRLDSGASSNLILTMGVNDNTAVTNAIFVTLVLGCT